MVETEIWDLSNGDSRTIHPTLTQGEYIICKWVLHVYMIPPICVLSLRSILKNFLTQKDMTSSTSTRTMTSSLSLNRLTLRLIKQLLDECDRGSKPLTQRSHEVTQDLFSLVT